MDLQFLEGKNGKQYDCHVNIDKTKKKEKERKYLLKAVISCFHDYGQQFA